MFKISSGRWTCRVDQPCRSTQSRSQSESQSRTQVARAPGGRSIHGSVSQSVSYFTVPPRAHPSTGSQSGSAAPQARDWGGDWGRDAGFSQCSSAQPLVTHPVTPSGSICARSADCATARTATHGVRALRGQRGPSGDTEPASYFSYPRQLLRQLSRRRASVPVY